MLARSFGRSSRRRRCGSGFVLALEPAWNRRLEAHQRPSQLGNVIFDKLTVIVDHVLSDTGRLELVVQRPPLWRRRVVVVEDPLCAPRPLGRINVDKLAPRSRLLATTIGVHSITQRNCTLVVDGLLQPVLVPRRHPLVEVAGLARIFKEQSHETVFDLKRMEELSILVIGEIHPQFLVPHHPAVPEDIHHLEEERVSHQVVHKYNGTYQAGVGPFGGGRVGNVESSHGSIEDLVVGLRDHPLDFLLVGGR